MISFSFLSLDQQQSCVYICVCMCACVCVHIQTMQQFVQVRLCSIIYFDNWDIVELVLLSISTYWFSFWEQEFNSHIFDIGSKPFIQPEIIPPFWSDKISKPL